MSSVNPAGPNGSRSDAPDDGVAVIGLSCMFPGAPDVKTFWRNILGKVDAVTDPPPEAWDSDVYYDPMFEDTDKVYCQRGGYLGSLASFDPLLHGIPPVSVGGEPDQWLALQLAHDAMADADCLDLPEKTRQRTEVILGKGTYLNGGNAIAVEHGLVIGQTIEIIRKLNPDFSNEQIEQLRDEMKQVLPPMNAETVPGLIPNIIVGRIANRMDLMGPAYTVDAACASSLVAIQHAIRDLRNGDCDVALVGGSQVWMPVPTLNVFCRLGALSRRQQIRPFDQDADGTLLGEGIGMAVLKRLSDAERDGNRIYAVIRGAGMSSDGRGVSVMAPRIDGEELALRRAYESAGISPRSIGLIEAHGTATPVGDVVEIQALTRVFGQRQDLFPHCAIGTVKSMISHTIPASGIAGLIKTSLSLHHKVLPPTINCDVPNPKLELEKTPFYINTETRPWIHGGSEPRRAGINAFGFGGINAHVIVEEYTAPFVNENTPQLNEHLPAWESEVFIVEGATPSDIVSGIDQLIAFLNHSSEKQGDQEFTMADLSSSVNAQLGKVDVPLRLAIIATDVADLMKKLTRAKTKLADPNCQRIKEVSGIYYFQRPLGRNGKIAMMFPGEGSQYTNMLADLCLHFPEVRAIFDRSDRIFRDHQRNMVLSDVLYPRPTFNEADRQEAERRLMQMDMAIEAVLTSNEAIHTLLHGLALKPDVVVGHSTGEYSAMAAGGTLELERDDQVAEFSLALNRHYPGASETDGIPKAMMLAIGADRERAEAIAQEAGGDVFLAMDNCPHQSVLVGERNAVERAREITQREQLIFEELTFDRAYHTELFRPYAENLRSVFEDVQIRDPRTPVLSCTTATEYPRDPERVRDLVVEHWTSPVEFQRTINAMYDSGVRVFVESGARGNLSAFVEDILRGREFSAIPANVLRRSSITQLNHMVGQLAAQGIDLNWSYLYRHRSTRQLDLESLDVETLDGRASRKIDLSIAWPMLKISDETAEALNSQRTRLTSPFPNAAVNHTQSAPDHDHASLAKNSHDDVAADEPLLSDENLVKGFSTSVSDFAGTESSSGEAVDALHSYFETMDGFLATQADVMNAFFASGPAVNAPVSDRQFEVPESTDMHSNQWRFTDVENSPTTRISGVDARQSGASSGKPLLGTIITHVPDVKMVARRVFNRDEDLYLDDHTLGHALAGSRSNALAIMPLTLSLEILAEAASFLVPGKRVTGLCDVQAHRWVAFDDQPQELEVSATKLRSDDGIVRVQATLTNVSDVAGGVEAQPSPAVVATIELSNAYPASITAIDKPEGYPSKRTPEELYRSVMFHGSRWQGVETIDLVGPSGAEATLRVLSPDRFFREAGCPEFEIDPITLDAAGQVVGFWTTEVLDSGKIVFPFHIDRLDIYGSSPARDVRVTCRAAIQLIGSHLTSSTIDVVGADGHIWMRLSGWQDRRFDLPTQFEPLMLPENSGDISTVWSAPMSPYGDTGAIECRQVSASIASDSAFWSRVWSEAILSEYERDDFRALRTPEPRRLEWLAARTAAKDAVRSLSRMHFGIELMPSEITIYHDDRGAPKVFCEAFEESEFVPILSLSHTSGTAASIAGFVTSIESGPSTGIGIDIEWLKPLPDGFVETAFAASERALFDSLGLSKDNEWILRAWCAKEAIAKAMGSGLINGPRSLEIVSIDSPSGIVVAHATGELARETLNTFMAHTGRDADLAFATATCDLTDTNNEP